MNAPPAGILGEILDRGADRKLLREELYRQAAECYDRAGLVRDAAECLRHSGRAVEAGGRYENLGLYERACACYTEAGEYGRAREVCEKWGERAKTGAAADRISHALWLSSLLRLQGVEEARARQLLASARSDLEAAVSEKNRNAGYRGRLWEMLGACGARLKRWDLVSLGYESALSCYGDSAAEDRSRAAREYLALSETNRLLRRNLEERIREWEEGTATLRPAKQTADI